MKPLARPLPLSSCSLILRFTADLDNVFSLLSNLEGTVNNLVMQLSKLTQTQTSACVLNGLPSTQQFWRQASSLHVILLKFVCQLRPAAASAVEAAQTQHMCRADVYRQSAVQIHLPKCI